MKKLMTMLLMIMMLTSMVACGGSEEAASTADGGMFVEKAMEAPAETEAAMADMAGSSMSYKEESVEELAEGSGTNALEGRKIIKNGYIYMETLEYDRTIEAVNQMIAKYGGYTSFSETNNGNLYEGQYYHRSSHFTIKVPADFFDAMYKEMNTVGNVVNANEGKRDVTLEFIDTESRLRTLKVQEDRLLAILEKSEKLEDVIELENSLQEVRYEIERNTTDLRHLQDLVSFSTIELNVQEVYEEREVEKPAITFGDRISSGLKRTFGDLKNTGENLLVFVITQFPYLLILAVIVGLVVRSVKKYKIKETAMKEKAAGKGEGQDDDPS